MYYNTFKETRSEISVSPAAELPIRNIREDIDEDFEEDRTGCNKRESLLCLFVKQILEDCSTRKKPLRQEGILRKLDEYPYCICVDRKTLSRTLNTLMDEYPNILRNKDGVWYEAERRVA